MKSTEKLKYLLLGFAAFCIAVSCNSVKTEPDSTILKFDFGNGETAKGYLKVASTDLYSAEKGFGFASNPPLQSVERNEKDILTSDFITGIGPFYFSVNLPEGNYEIKIGLGDPKGESQTTVKAESRRLMLENIQTKNGEIVTKTIMVNVRTPKINETESIRLKSREHPYLNWDNKLSLEFNHKKPCVSFVEIKRIENIPVIFLAGNSTVVDQEYEPWASWGQMLPNFLKPEIVVANFAESGEALLSFKGEKRLQKILSLMKKGDYLFIEFAHNDQKPGGAHLDAATTYKDELKYYIQQARNLGGIPVLVTSMHRRKFDENGKIINTLEGFPEAVRETAAETNTPFIDLNKMSKAFYETMGPENSKHAFVHYPAGTYPGQTEAFADNTHFNPYGAYQLAKCIVKGIQELDLQLKKYLKDDLLDFNPANPDSFEDFYWSESEGVDLLKPDGN